MSECIDHKRAGNRQTYAYCWRDGKQYPLHRLVYADTNDLDITSLSFDQVVRHTCDNRRCINPEHLIIGSRAENTKDMVSRGRFRSKLTEDQVTDILLSSLPLTDLMKTYKVSKTTIQRIKKRLSWTVIETESVKSRLKTCLGEENGNSVLTWDAVREILSSTETQRSLAARFGVSQYTIWAIKNGKTWRGA